MARPIDPLDDMERVADLIDQAKTLVTHGADRRETGKIIAGLAHRLREDILLVRSRQQTFRIGDQVERFIVDRFPGEPGYAPPQRGVIQTIDADQAYVVGETYGEWFSTTPDTNTVLAIRHSKEGKTNGD